ncbi:protein FAM177A1-like [Thalassophryne amazonica]|uniref:protein FAM177A1-like n=1 Tax=Thalassophryne amazonica TaxID=390379 RepID=UPI001470FACB|nr:protein FAM177A1-like [Thalassophryne amazonica]
MSSVSPCLTHVNAATVCHMDGQQISNPNQIKDFESVELGDVDNQEEQPQKEKVPRRIIHFSSGETMEEYSTDEEDEEDKDKQRKDLLAFPADAMSWGPYFWFHMWRAATSTISACDYLGEKMASLFGITSAKYQYAIDEYYRMKKEKEEEEENRLSEAEQSSQHLQTQKSEHEPTDSQTDMTNQIENENKACSSTIRVPALVTVT